MGTTPTAPGSDRPGGEITMTTNKKNTIETMIDAINAAAGYDRFAIEDRDPGDRYPGIVDLSAGQLYWYGSALYMRNALSRLVSRLDGTDPGDYSRVLCSVRGVCGVDSYPVC